jgi:hypothetical protein
LKGIVFDVFPRPPVSGFFDAHKYFENLISVINKGYDDRQEMH